MIAQKYFHNQKWRLKLKWHLLANGDESRYMQHAYLVQSVDFNFIVIKEPCKNGSTTIERRHLNEEKNMIDSFVSSLGNFWPGNPLHCSMESSLPHQIMLDLHATWPIHQFVDSSIFLSTKMYSALSWYVHNSSASVAWQSLPPHQFRL